jgi:hypothetical protein
MITQMARNRSPEEMAALIANCAKATEERKAAEATTAAVKRQPIVGLEFYQKYHGSAPVLWSIILCNCC